MTSLMVVTALVILIGISVSALALNDLQSSYAAFKNEELIDLSEACVEDVLLKLNEENSIPSSVTLPQGSCTVTSNSQVGTNWDFTVEASKEGYTKNIRIVADRTSGVLIESWQEE